MELKSAHHRAWIPDRVRLAYFRSGGVNFWRVLRNRLRRGIGRHEHRVARVKWHMNRDLHLLSLNRAAGM